jgi:hypothetical protein
VKQISTCACGRNRLPVRRSTVNYFAVGHSSECFRYIKNWVEKKVRRHMLRARKRKGFGWKRWSSQWLYENLFRERSAFNSRIILFFYQCVGCFMPL